MNFKEKIDRMLTLAEMKKWQKTRPHMTDALLRKFLELYLSKMPENLVEFLSDTDLIEFCLHRLEYASEIGGTRKLSSFSFVKNRIQENPQEFWLSNLHLLEIVMPDAAFLKDSLLEFIQNRGWHIQSLIHHVFHVRRDNGIIRDILDKKQARLNGNGQNPEYNREFWATCFIDSNGATDKKEIQKEIGSILQDIYFVTSDFQVMSQTLSDHNRNPENKRFVDWLLRDNFIFMGMQNGKKQYGLFRRKEYENKFRMPALKKGDGIAIAKTDILSDINRRENITLLNIAGLQIAGMFTRKANSTGTFTIPILKDRIRELKKDPALDWSTQDMADFIYTYNLFPLDDRFHYNIREFIPFHHLVNEARLKVKSFLRLGMMEKNRAYFLALWPIEEFSEDIDKKIENRFRQDKITILRKTDRTLPSLMFMLYELEPTPAMRKMIKNRRETETWEDKLHETLLTWDRKITALIKSKFTRERATQYLNEIIPGFPEEYKTRNTIEESYRDIRILESMKSKDKIIDAYLSSGPRKEFDPNAGPPVEQAYLKFFLKASYTLSYLVPILSNFGLQVLEEESYRLTIENETVHLYKFHIEHSESQLTIESLRRFTEALERIIENKASSEPLNALILSTRISIFQLELLKALVAYLVQVKKGYSRVSIKRVLAIRSALSIALIDQFLAKFLPPMIERMRSNPELARRVALMIPDFPDNLRDVENYIAAKKKRSQKVELETLLQNETYGGIKAVIEAIVRTNFFARAEAISFKIRPDLIPFSPQPNPLYEIWVHHSNFEGVHLRGGPVARGGLRWSSRADDFRTEVWGLWKTQVLKNSIIVPTGSKGGFVIKYRANNEENAIWAYRLFITSLLEITDNPAFFLQDKSASIPCLDSEDPYLVVAADKGTASFSDYANEISVDHEFWLGDAFASGGKNGYSHKALGITARGAWESARWHFYQMGVHPERDSVTVAGIGDMGGDVFGNGLILSSSILLVAAFNHKHIFIDPNPDPKQSFQERVRLFKSTGGWDQYNTKLISKGGGVFSREAISITLTAAAQKSLGTSATRLSGEELIRAILRAPVEMIFNGGIGTYIKAESEDHRDVDDHANDHVRVDAGEVRARVVVEGGNLGVSPKGRLEFARKGGLINTDAVDNSAGVDLSDHEVNLKILLNQKSMIRKFNHEKRNKYVHSVANEVVDLVLKNNFRQNWSIVHQVNRPKKEQQLLLEYYELLLSKGVINKKNEELPKIAELKADLEEKGTLSRPFICILLGYARIYCRKNYNRISQNFSRDALINYFPRTLSKFENQIKSHPLAKEITSMSLINYVTDEAGISYLYRCENYLGLTPAESIDAYLQSERNISSEIGKLQKYFPDFERRTFPPGTDFQQLMILKGRIDKSIYRYIEMGSLFHDKTPGWRKEEPLQPLSIGKKKLLYRGVPYLREIPAELQESMVQFFHVELRYVLQYLMPKLNEKEKEMFIEYYHTGGIRNLKREIYRIWPDNYWEIQTMKSIKRNFWRGLIRSFIKSPLQSGLTGQAMLGQKIAPKIDIDAEIQKLKDEQNLNISALAGLVGFLFSA